VAFSPDGRLALTGSWDKTARLWDVASGRQVRRLAGHAAPVLSVALSPDGRLALTGSDDGTARLWDVASGREVRQLAGHTGGVNSVAFSPDGRLALTGSRDKTARVWDFSRPAQYREFDAKVPHAYEVLRRTPEDPDALRVVGEWYAFRGLWDWACDFLERARAGGARGVSALTLGRCYWQRGDPGAARREFRRALEEKEAPAPYLELCLQRLDAIWPVYQQRAQLGGMLGAGPAGPLPMLPLLSLGPEESGK
jgi:hypothetical protein